MTIKNKSRRKASQASFTLIETVIALGLMVFLIIEFAGVQGNAVAAAEYGRRMTQATWLARRIMSQVEYFAATKDWKSLTAHETERPFEDFPEYKYDLDIKDWKLPLLSFLSGGLAENASGGEKKEATEGKSSGGPFEGILKQVLGDELLKIARVDVSWPEGAQRNSVGLSYLLVNQQKLDEVILTLKSVADTVDAPAPGTSPAPGASPLPGATPIPGGTTGGSTAGAPIR